MGRFVVGADRSQMTFLPECLDDWVGEDNPVHVIEAFVEALDLPLLGFEGAIAKATGRPVVPSGRTAEALHLRLSQPRSVEPSARTRGGAQRRADVATRPAGSRPQDDRRLSQREWRGHPQGLRTLRGAVPPAWACSQGDSVAVDGSKFKAVNNRDKNFTHAKMARRMAQIEESIERYLLQLDSADRQEPCEAILTKTARLKEKIGTVEAGDGPA